VVKLADHQATIATLTRERDEANERCLNWERMVDKINADNREIHVTLSRLEKVFNRANIEYQGDTELSLRQFFVKYQQDVATLTREVERSARDFTACRDALDGTVQQLAQAQAEREAATRRLDKIKARCPSCHNTTLFISEPGALVCSWIGCKNPVPERFIAEQQADLTRLRGLVEALDKITPKRPYAITYDNGIEILNHVQDVLLPAFKATQDAGRVQE
jgi:hypothetical protein